MNPNDKLLLLFNKTQNKWEDATEKVVSFKETHYFGNLSGYLVTFSSGNTYPYNKASFIFLTDPIIIDIKDKDIYVNKQLYLDVKKILKFYRYYKIFHQDGNTTLSMNVLLKDKIKDSQTNIFNYYNDLAYHAHKMSNSEESIQTYIYQQYKNICKVNSESALFVN